jgi:hypothetical protein
MSVSGSTLSKNALAESAAPVADGIHEPDAPDPRLKADARRAKPRGAIENRVKTMSQLFVITPILLFCGPLAAVPVRRLKVGEFDAYGEISSKRATMTCPIH